jgi:branched-chain amino acid transport system permease protein
VDLYVQYGLGGLTLGAIYALVGLGLVVVYKVSSIVNFAHGPLAVISALITISVWRTVDLPIGLTPVVGAAVGAVVGVVTFVVLIAPLWRRSIEGAVVMTIAGFLMLEGLAFVGWGGLPRSLDPVLTGPPVEILGGTMTRQALVILALTGGVALAFWFFLTRTVLGKALRACDDDRYGAELCGVSVQTMGMFALAVAGALGGLAGVLVAPLTGVQFTHGGTLLLRGLTAAIVGGLSSSSGAFVGGLVLGLLDSVVNGEIPQFREAIVFLSLITVLAIRPAGLLGARA